MVYRARILAAVLVLSACDAPMTMSMIDAGPPPPPPRDAGGPVCEGTAEACDTYAIDQCDAVPGCTSMTCGGAPPLCSTRTDFSACTSVRGCRWEMDLYCVGTPESCSIYRSQLACEDIGCTWGIASACSGSAIPCTSLSASQCTIASGCELAGASADGGVEDAGMGQDAGDDAGMNDAGVCDPSTGTECHPYYDADCGCEYSTSDTQYACGRAGTVAEGGSCDDFGVCAAGLFCHRATVSDPGICRARCEADSDCDAGSACALVQSEGDGAPCTGFCLPLAECSFLAQDCAAGEGCYVLVDADAGRNHFFCHPEGDIAAGGSCVGDNSLACQAGLICAQDNVIAFTRHCQPACDAESDCDALSDCTGMTAGIMHCE